MAAEVDLNIEYMYQAANELIPDKADHLAEITKRLGHHLQALDGYAAAAGDPAVLRNLLTAADQTYDALRVGVQSLNNASEAVRATAEDLRRSDADARRDFRNMNATLGDTPLQDVRNPPAEVPPDLGDPSVPGAPEPDDPSVGPSDGGHPSQGGTPSTPDPVAPEEDAEDREDQQQEEGSENPYVPEEV